MTVLDLSDYDTIDADDRRLIEKMLITYNKETVLNKRVPSGLSKYEHERVEQLVQMVDFNFVPYVQVKVEKMQKKEWRSYWNN